MASPEAIIVPRTRDLGNGFEVHRVLPAAQRRMVGPFVFFDHFGPTILRAGTGLDVRPHPHIGLATVTYLFDGEILHRDSLGTVQPIRPGEVNWMTAGRGIAHSERTPLESRARDSDIFGIQTWVGLPHDKEEIEPAFAHHGVRALPVIEGDRLLVRVIAGELYGKHSPVAVLTPMFYADALLAAGARLELPLGYEERAIYVVEGAVEIDDATFAAGKLLVFRRGDAVAIGSKAGARVLLLGGDPMDGPRHIWWNFVSSSKERIEQAKADWREGRFAPVPGDTEAIPLPE
jgi:hypothetical protein